MLKIIDCEQLSPEWYAAKCGVPSASNFDKIVTTKGEPSKQRTKYMYQLAGETITGIQEDTYQNATMLRGIELEAEARQLYQLVTGTEVQQVGFCMANGFGASPDGFVGKPGLLEIKCPIVSTHVGYLREEIVPTTYFQQLEGQLLVTGREWLDFFSYYPGMKPLLIRVQRNEGFIDSLRMELDIFCEELKKLVEEIR